MSPANQDPANGYGDSQDYQPTTPTGDYDQGYDPANDPRLQQPLPGEGSTQPGAVHPQLAADVPPAEPPLTPAPEQPRSGGLPLRGLAMVLLAVAVLLGAWGIYSIRNSDEEQTLPGNTTDPAPASASQNSPAAPPVQPNPAATASADPAQQDLASPQPAAQPNPADAPGDAPEQPAPAAQPVPVEEAKKTVVVHVLNNSTIQGLANRTSDTLKNTGWRMGEVGNYPDSNLPATVVYYAPGLPAEEAAARAVAEQLGATAEPHDMRDLGELSDNAVGVVVVVTEDQNR